MKKIVFAACAATAAICLGAGFASHAEPAAPAAAPAPLVLYFDSGSAAVRPEDVPILDHASRLYRDGQPIVMVVTGATDAVGAPEANLRLSQMRAGSVLRALVARGIPAARFQVLAKGATDPAIPVEGEVAEPRNRRVEITWR